MLAIHVRFANIHFFFHSRFRFSKCIYTYIRMKSTGIGCTKGAVLETSKRRLCWGFEALSSRSPAALIVDKAGIVVPGVISKLLVVYASPQFFLIISMDPILQ